MVSVIDQVSRVLEPRVARDRAVASGLVLRREHPLNAETPVAGLIGGTMMPSTRFYLRNHFAIPLLEPGRWRLQVGGLVERPLRLSLADLRRMPSESLLVTLECAGNGRSLLGASVPGEPWGLGAVSTAEWTGVPLVEVLHRAGVRAGAGELVFRGADLGAVASRSGPVRFERSLPLDEAVRSDAILAHAMNGEPIPVEYGSPLRLIVPGWYGMASVKWLTEIAAIDRTFHGPFQTDVYVYERKRDGRTEAEPVTRQRLRALITEPAPDAVVERGDVAVRGLAWSGTGPVSQVEVRVGTGPWRAARLSGERNRHAWRRWELILRMEAPGPTIIRARARDRSGATQPEEPQWSRLGYGNNAIQRLPILVR